MLLSEVRFTNLKGCPTETVVPLDRFSALVGRNDAGKSTVFLALDLFLNNTKPSADYATVGTGSTEVIVEVAFLPDGTVIRIDDVAETSFEVEELVDEDGLVRVRKRWDTASSSRKPNVEIRRKSYKKADFLLSIEKDLISQCKDLGIATRKANNDEFNNVEKRAKLREYHRVNGTDSEYQWTPLKSNGSGRDKLILNAFDEVCPKLQYFRADTSLSESDTSIQNYFRDHATAALTKHGLDEIEDRVTAEVQAVLDDVSTRINQAMPEANPIRAQMEFDWSKIAKLKFATADGESAIPLELRGDGFRRVTMMAYFEHLADTGGTPGKRLVYAFEEPETFLHPAAQEQLLGKLLGMADSGLQVLLSSHAPVLVSGVPTDSLIHAVRQDGTTSYKSGLAEIQSVVEDLGISPNHNFIRLYESARCLLLVEGPDDVSALRHVEAAYFAAGHIEGSFEDLGVVFLPIGGCTTITWWMSLGLLADLGKPFFVYIDSDKESSTEASPNKAALEVLGLSEGKDFYVTEKRELENYIPDSVLSRLSGCTVTYGDFDDVKRVCRGHQEAGKLGGKKVGGKYFGRMTLADLRVSYSLPDGTDEFERLHGAIAKRVAEA